MTVKEAAALLGITPDAVRSKLRRGKLRRAEAPDGTVLVVLDGDSPDGQNGHLDGHQTVAYIDVLKSHIDLLERELAEWKAEARRKDHLLAAALERIPSSQLESPRDEPRAPEGACQDAGRVEERDETAEAQTATQEPEETARRPWWARIFSGQRRGRSPYR
ncbi:MAG: helix-turn-helix domain-containing protein [Actinomycetota bacterium]|nr:helix-turn-helix domain-containing protein [Actinomycetota bacterium]